MDVRCERCKTEYEFDESRITESGVAVKCASCGHIFMVRKAIRAPAAAAPAAAREWKLRKPFGATVTFRELTTLQKWIVEGKVAREDEISLKGETWKKLGSIPELQPFFQVFDNAQKQKAPTFTPAPEEAGRFEDGAANVPLPGPARPAPQVEIEIPIALPGSSGGFDSAVALPGSGPTSGAIPLPGHAAPAGAIPLPGTAAPAARAASGAIPLPGNSAPSAARASPPNVIALPAPGEDVDFDQPTAIMPNLTQAQLAAMSTTPTVELPAPVAAVPQVPVQPVVAMPAPVVAPSRPAPSLMDQMNEVMAEVGASEDSTVKADLSDLQVQPGAEVIAGPKPVAAPPVAAPVPAPAPAPVPEAKSSPIEFELEPEEPATQKVAKLPEPPRVVASDAPQMAPMKTADEPKKSRAGLAIAAALAACALGGGGYWYMSQKGAAPSPKPVASKPAETKPATKPAATQEKTAVAEKLAQAPSAPAANAQKLTEQPAATQPEPSKATVTQAVAQATPEPAKTEPAKTETAQAEPAKTEPAKAEPAKTEPAKTETAQAEPAKTEPAKTEPAKTEPAKTEPAKTETAQAAPAKTDAPANPVASAKTEEKPEVAPAKATEPAPAQAEAAKEPEHDYDWYVKRGDRLRNSDHSRSAVGMYQKAIALQPDKVEPLAGLGLALLDLGKNAEAVKTFGRALEVNPRYGVAVMGMAEACRAAGENAAAKKYYERFLEITPNGPEAEAAKAQIARLSQ